MPLIGPQYGRIAGHRVAYAIEVYGKERRKARGGAAHLGNAVGEAGATAPPGKHRRRPSCQRTPLFRSRELYFSLGASSRAPAGALFFLAKVKRRRFFLASPATASKRSFFFLCRSGRVDVTGSREMRHARHDAED